MSDPNQADMIPFPCVELDCGYLSVRSLPECEKARCPWAYTRRREEDAIDREKKDAKAKEDGKCL